jgi:integrase
MLAGNGGHWKWYTLSVPLHLYRRHNAECSQTRPPESISREPQENPRFKWKKCDCSIFASGKLTDGFKRKNTGKSTWEEAKAQATTWEQAGSWAAPSVPLVTPSETGKPDPQSVTIESEMEMFFAKTTTRHPPLEPTTVKKHKTFKKHFLAFCASKGYVTMRQLQPGDMELFYSTWKDGTKARANKLGKLRSLKKFLLRRKSITPDLAEEITDIKTPHGASNGADRVPYSDWELERLYAACDKLPTVTWTDKTGTHSYSGDDVKDFIILAIFTGLRISDIATFDTKRRFRRDNHIFLRMKKSKKELNTWVPDWVLERLNDRERRFGNKIFRTGVSENLDTVTFTWRKRLKRVFEIAQAEQRFETKPIPHRFRYTFVRILLEAGVPTPMVADLAGDTEEVILKYYKQWVPELQAKLTNTLKLAFQDKNRLIAIKGGKSA